MERSKTDEVWFLCHIFLKISYPCISSWKPNICINHVKSKLSALVYSSYYSLGGSSITEMHCSLLCGRQVWSPGPSKSAGSRVRPTCWFIGCTFLLHPYVEEDRDRNRHKELSHWFTFQTQVQTELGLNLGLHYEWRDPSTLPSPAAS